MKIIQYGFTLIELLIVIAIIGILATIALPTYQSYSSKAKFIEVVLATSPMKQAVELCGQINNDITSEKCSAVAALNEQEQESYVESIHYTNGTNEKNEPTAIITATASKDLGSDDKGDAYTYILTGALSDNGQVIWTQSGTCEDAGICD